VRSPISPARGLLVHRLVGVVSVRRGTAQQGHYIEPFFSEAGHASTRIAPWKDATCFPSPRSPSRKTWPFPEYVLSQRKARSQRTSHQRLIAFSHMALLATKFLSEVLGARHTYEVGRLVYSVGLEGEERRAMSSYRVHLRRKEEKKT
jgi:hypothetical protein